MADRNWVFEGEARWKTIPYGVLNPEENRSHAPFIMNKERGEANDPRYQVLALLQTCRQIYHEARLMIFSLNAFSIENERALDNWIRLFGARMDDIHTVRIFMTSGYASEIKSVSLLHKFAGLQTVEVVVALSSHWKIVDGQIEEVDFMDDDVPDLERKEAAMAKEIEWRVGDSVQVKFLRKRC